MESNFCEANIVNRFFRLRAKFSELNLVLEANDYNYTICDNTESIFYAFSTLAEVKSFLQGIGVNVQKEENTD